MSHGKYQVEKARKGKTGFGKNTKLAIFSELNDPPNGHTSTFKENGKGKVFANGRIFR